MEKFKLFLLLGAPRSDTLYRAKTIESCPQCPPPRPPSKMVCKMRGCKIFNCNERSFPIKLFYFNLKKTKRFSGIVIWYHVSPIIGLNSKFWGLHTFWMFSFFNHTESLLRCLQEFISMRIFMRIILLKFESKAHFWTHLPTLGPVTLVYRFVIFTNLYACDIMNVFEHYLS